MSSFTQTAALVTGASRGIGKAVARRLAADGQHVIINYRSNDAAALETLEEIRAAGGSAELCKFDVTDRSSAASRIDELLGAHTLRTFVFNAGVRDDQPLVFMTAEQWDRILSTNLLCFHTLVKPVVRQMLLNRCGRIIVVSSTSGEAGMPGQVHYAASKAGLIGAVKSLALECAKRNVLVNAIAPGFIATDMTASIDAGEVTKRIPMGRMGTVDEVAAVVSFLASADASYITGQVIGVNGGAYL